MLQILTIFAQLQLKYNQDLHGEMGEWLIPTVC